MSRRPTTQQTVRLFAHGAVCVSEGCKDSSERAQDHADRTQRPVGRAVAKWEADPARHLEGLQVILHDAFCLGCTNPAGHIDRLRPISERLLDRLA